MAWVYLIVAELFEIGWPVGLGRIDCGRDHRPETGPWSRLKGELPHDPNRE